ncbi:PIR protein [Plasmodium ovale]|uniref:PIR Superfamily Protein n=2 Tax=Plasmodium ovale TaxID=36330 RepID=A0A1A8WS56_PLAOA|nr:PIR Superfamily Protein [Plasmodium ovale curtisi]SBT84719.1 PIR protein [Plasmodium ovale]
MSEESYNFFQYFDDYIKYEESIQAQWNTSVYKNGCAFDGRINVERLNDVEVICAKFKYLYNLLFYSLPNYHKHEEYAEYLNFWVNSQLKNNKIPTITVKDFYNNVMLYSFLFDSQKKVQNKIYDINDDLFTNMEILYDLYRNYYNILILTKTPKTNNNCLQYSTNCVQVYEQAINKCPKDNTVFCKALKDFKEKYDGINNPVSLKNCKEEELLALPKYKGPSLEGTLQEGQLKFMEEPNDQAEHASTTYFNYVFGFIGTILGIFFTLLILYKYTPFRSRLFRGIINQRKILTNLDETYNQESLLDNSELDHHNSDNMSYNVLYNSTLIS